MKVDHKLPPQIVEKGEEMGYRPDLLPLLMIVPFVQVAWAEGFVQACEQKAILRFAANLGIAPGHAAYEKLLGWFDERPDDQFFDRSLDDLRELLADAPTGEAARLRSILQFGCVETARASGEIGLRRDPSAIRHEERDVLARVSERLGLAQASA